MQTNIAPTWSPSALPRLRSALMLVLAVAFAGFAPAQPPRAQAATPVTVSPIAPNGWGFGQEVATGTGSFVAGPATAPLGAGSARMTLNATGREVLGTLAYSGTLLSQLTSLEYSTYRSSADAGDNLAISLQLNIDYDMTDANTAWQGRLIYEPYLTAGVRGTVTQNTWRGWDPLAPDAKWWASGAPGDTKCTQGTPCTWQQVKEEWQNAGFSGLVFKAGGPWANFDGNVDAFTIGVDGRDTTYDFEPLMVVYVDDSWAGTPAGSDPDADGPANAFGGDAFATIQAGIDAVASGGTVRVFPGDYSETAANRTIASIGGTYTFGLFFGAAKSGVTLQGVDTVNQPITAYASAQATVNTNATNNFGPSGVFVEGDDVTIAGIQVGTNSAGRNKTIEVIGDNFTLKHSDIADPLGSVYMNDFRFDTVNNTSHVKGYTIDGNLFGAGVSLDIASGAGFSGPVSGRVIANNVFEQDGSTRPAISFSGTGGVPWFAHPVGGAQIEDNSFAGAAAQYIRARGTYDNSQFDWATYWNANTFDKAVVVGPNPPADVRVFSYISGAYTFTNVRRIGATIQGEVDHAQADDTVLVNAGTYNEQITIASDNLTIQGAGVGATVIQNTSSPGTGVGIALSSSRSDITLRDLTVKQFEDGIRMPTGPLTNILLEDVESSNNQRHGIWSQAFGVSNLTLLRVNASNNNAGGGQAGRGVWIINGVKTNITIENGTFNNNGLVGIDVSDGSVTGLSIVGNTVVGNFDSGIGVLGAQGPGANLVDGNTVTNNGRFGIEIKNPNGSGAESGSGSVVVSRNRVSRTTAATRAEDYAGIAVFRRGVDATYNADQPVGVVISANEVGGYRRKPSGSTGDGFGIVVEGTGHTVKNNIVTDNDVGLQVQGGNPAANEQSTDYFDRGNASTGVATTTLNMISDNGIGARSVSGAAVTLFDATTSWWGSPTGPSGTGNPGGTGDSMSENIGFEPWLCDGTDTSPAIGFQPNPDAVCGGETPDTSITAQPANPSSSTTATFAFTGTDDFTPLSSLAFECQLDGAGFTACTGDQTYTNLALGSHTFEVRAKDPRGEIDASPATYTWIVVAPADTTAPETTIGSKPANPSSSTTATFTFVGTDDVTPPASLTFECQLDGAGFADCTSGKTYTGLANGSHTFQVRARDAAGNVETTPASYTWTVAVTQADTTPPNTTIVSGPPSSSSSATATFTFNGTDNVTPPAGLTFECRLDGAAFAPCSSPKTYSGLQNGVHTFQVRAKDAAGNVDQTPATYSWTIKLSYSLYLPVIQQ